MNSDQKNGIIATVVGGLILTGILAIIPKARNFLWDLILWIWTFLFSDHSFSLYGWLWLIIGISAFVGLFIVMKTIFDKNSRDKYREKEGEILGLKFRWKESKDSIYSLRCFCPGCDYELTRDRNPYAVTFDSWALPYCPCCDFRSNALRRNDLRDIVEREIERQRRSLE